MVYPAKEYCYAKKDCFYVFYGMDEPRKYSKS